MEGSSRMVNSTTSSNNKGIHSKDSAQSKLLVDRSISWSPDSMSSIRYIVTITAE